MTEDIHREPKTPYDPGSAQETGGGHTWVCADGGWLTSCLRCGVIRKHTPNPDTALCPQNPAVCLILKTERDIRLMESEAYRAIGGDVEGQAGAWAAIFELCFELGMTLTSAGGREDTLAFIRELERDRARLNWIVESFREDFYCYKHSDGREITGDSLIEVIDAAMSAALSEKAAGEEEAS